MAQSVWEIAVGSQRAYIIMPKALIEGIDSLVGVRGRSAFLVETARAEVRRRKLLAYLEGDKPAWRDEDHPELAGDAAAWVRQLRAVETDRLIRRHEDDAGE